MASPKFKKDTQGFEIQESFHRIPLKSTTTTSVADGETDDVTVTVSSGEMWFIKSWAITLGDNSTCNSIKIDGNDTYQIVDCSDTVSTYGDLLSADSTIVMSVTNAGQAAEDNVLTVWGWKLTGI
jgi:hypothetical protein